MARKKPASSPAPRPATRPAFSETRIVEAPASEPQALPDWFLKGTPKVPNAILFDRRLSATARVVASFLYQTCRPGSGEASGDQKEMARRLGLSRPRLTRALDELWKHRVIYDQVRMRLAGGGYYLVYFLQRYPVETLREAVRPRLVETRTQEPKAKAPSAKKRPAPAPSGSGCGECHGGWIYRDGREGGVDRCPTCRPGSRK